MGDHRYADVARTTLPDNFLLAIGKVCAQWSYLEMVVDLALKKFAGVPDDDARGMIFTVHMSWPQKMDVLRALIDALNHDDYPWLKRFGEVAPLLKRAQDGRNRYVHARWGHTNSGEPLLLRATARGELKLRMDTVSAGDIEQVGEDIGRAAASLLKLVVNRM